MIQVPGLEGDALLFGYYLDDLGAERGLFTQQSLFDSICHGPEEIGEPWEAAWIDLGGEG